MSFSDISTPTGEMSDVASYLLTRHAAFDERTMTGLLCDQMNFAELVLDGGNDGLVLRRRADTSQLERLSTTDRNTPPYTKWP